MAKKKINLQGRIVDTLIGVGGGLAGKFINKPLQNMNPKLRSVLKMGVGIGIPMLVKNDMVAKAGQGLAIVAGGELAGAMVPALAGDDDFATLNATEYPYAQTEELLNDEDIQGLADEGSEATLQG